MFFKEAGRRLCYILAWPVQARIARVSISTAFAFSLAALLLDYSPARRMSWLAGAIGRVREPIED
jgi:hypothetical protein